MKIKIPNEGYNVLKWICLIVLPASEAFYYTLALIWGLPKPVEISGTISAVQLFLGALIGISTINYNKEETNNDK